MKQPIRFFSIGLFVASILLYGFYFFFGQSTSTQTELTVDEMITEVETEGYRVISEEDYVSYTLHKEEENEKEQKNDKSKNNIDKNKNKKEEKGKKKSSKKKRKKRDKEKDKDDDVIKHTFTTSDGVVSQDIDRKS